MTDPGRFRNPVEIAGPTRVADDGGGYVDTYAALAQFGVIWAEILPLSGYEQLRAMQMASGVTHRIRAWWVDGITAEMQVWGDGRVFEIIAPPVNPDGQKELMELLVREHAVIP